MSELYAPNGRKIESTKDGDKNDGFFVNVLDSKGFPSHNDINTEIIRNFLYLKSIEGKDDEEHNQLRERANKIVDLFCELSVLRGLHQTIFDGLPSPQVKVNFVDQIKMQVDAFRRKIKRNFLEKVGKEEKEKE